MNTLSIKDYPHYRGIYKDKDFHSKSAEVSLFVDSSTNQIHLDLNIVVELMIRPRPDAILLNLEWFNLCF